MLETFIVLLAYHFVGELIVRSLNWPIPGAVLGMLLLFLTLVIKRGLPTFLAENTPRFMSIFVLMFVPAGVGVMQYFDLLADNFIGMTITLVVAVIVTQLASAWLLKFLLLRSRARRIRRLGARSQ